MSYTEIFGVKKNGDIVSVGETDNAWKGAMHVWSNLADKYHIEGGMFGGFQKLWKLADTDTLNKFENIAMKSTFDSVIVKKEDIVKLLEAFAEYDDEFPHSTLVEQGQIIADNILDDDEFIGVCWNQTSVNQSPWFWELDENDNEVSYNIFKGDKHWFLFD